MNSKEHPDNHLKTSYACELYDVKCRTNTIEHVPVYSEFMCPFGIRFKKCCDPHKILEFSIYHGKHKLFCIPMSLLIRLCGLYCDSEHYGINIDPELIFRDSNNFFMDNYKFIKNNGYFFRNDYLCGPITVMLTGENIIDFTLVCKYLFYDMEIGYTFPGPYLTNMYFGHTVNDNVILFDGSIKNSPGFFIETEDQLGDVEIKRNDGVFIQNYDRFTLNTFLIRKPVKCNCGDDVNKNKSNDISQTTHNTYLYYIPFFIMNGKHNEYGPRTTILCGNEKISELSISFKNKICGNIWYMSINKFDMSKIMPENSCNQ